MSSNEAKKAVQAPLRHVVIGVGAGILGAHQRGLSLDTTELVAVSDVNPELGGARAEELECSFYQDHKKMLAETKPDVAVIITPHTFHADLTIDALEAGAHVIVEKPMALHVAEADAMIEAAQKTGRLVAINFQQRFRPEIVKARELIEAGALGQIQNIDMKAVWPRSAAYYASGGWRATWKGEGGGVLMNQAPHNLDLICHLMGAPSRVSAWTRNLIHPIEVEDTIHALLEWENGALGFMHISTAEAGHGGRLELLGTNGTLEIGGGSLTQHRFETDLRDFFPNTTERYRGPAVNPVEVTLDALTTGDHRDVYQNMHDAILNGGSVLADAVEGRMSLELANAMIYSSYLNKPVELPIDREAYASLLADLQAGKIKLNA